MTAQAAKKPFSIRLSETISALLGRHAKESGMTASEFTRKAIENFLSRGGVAEAEFNQRIAALAEQPTISLRQIRETLKAPNAPGLPPESCAFLANLVHQAYFKMALRDVRINPDYVKRLVEMGIRLSKAFIADGETLHVPYVTSKWGISQASLESLSVDELTQQVLLGAAPPIVASQAEHLVRPLSVQAQQLNRLPVAVFRDLFDVDTCRFMLQIALKAL